MPSHSITCCAFEDEITSSKLCTIDELVKENFQDVCNDEDDNEELIFSSFNEVLRSVETLRKHFMCHRAEEKTFFYIKFNK